MARGAKRAAVETGPLEEPWELPDGWRWERLQDVAEINPKTDLGAAGDEPVTFLGMAAVSEESGRVDVSVVRPASQVARGFTRFRSGDVLFAKITPCMENGKMAVVPELASCVGVGSTEFHVVRSDILVPKFLFHFLVQRDVRQDARRNMSGTAGQMRVPTDYLRLLPVPVPPMKVQRQLVSRIDELFADIDDGEYGLAAANSAASTYRRTLLNAAVKGDLTADWRSSNAPSDGAAALLSKILHQRRSDAVGSRKAYKEPPGAIPPEGRSLPPSWCWASVRQLMGTIRNGTSAKPTEDPRGAAVLRISAVRPMSVDLSSARRMSASFDPAGFLAEPGDLLVTRYNGSSALVGVCGRHRGSVPVVHPDKLVRLVPVLRNDTLTDYIELAMNVGHSRAYIERNTKTTAGQQGVSGETIGETPIPLPPLEEIEEIVSRVRRGLAYADSLMATLAEGSGPDVLRQSILAAAFRGELS